MEIEVKLEPSFINNLDCTEIEIVPDIVFEENFNSVSESSKNDIVALSSDDDACNEDDNYEINIKVLWRSVRLDRLNMRRHDSFLKIFQHYADLEKVSVNEILIMKNDKIISRIDTPALLNLSVIDILDGGIVNPGMNELPDKNKKDDEEDICSIKVQTGNKKESLTIPLKKNQQFRTLFSYCAVQFGEEESNLKFYFDGEQIGLSDTPESLDMEGEACIDLRISSA
ncbi:NFATC2-interacting protein [Harpegnathos saltator]|uniref:NFATC2-interacting protein n=1 Tax=Harpegnathos saltator TaxID=610380 RepID=E2BNW8_HARSA|nr:NFATC2-interacting protein [Harpegnathos saltator]